MGFLDRLLGKSSPAPKPAATPAPRPAPAINDVPAPPSSQDAASETTAPAGGLLPQLHTARQSLEARDLPGAMAIYEHVLSVAGDRPDILVTISGDLGANGYVQEIIELIAPRYDAERHGAGTGLNLLQAYLATRQPGPAQHLLDILFGLDKPELEQRLWGFSNALADLIEAEKRGGAAGPAGGASSATSISLITISRPIWSYGLEALPAVLPAKTDRMRNIAFAQLALPGLKEAREVSARPEDALGRLTRGLPLWLADAFYFSSVYKPIAAIGTAEKHHVLFPSEWTVAHLRQLVDTSGEKLDFAVLGALQEKDGDHELVLHVWEIRRMRERKQISARWTPSTAASALTQLRTDLCQYMEWGQAPAPASLAYDHAADPLAWADTLGTSLTLFLTTKGVMAPEQAATALAELATLGSRAASSEVASLAWLTAATRARDLGHDVSTPQLVDTPLVSQALAQTGLG